MKRTAKHLALFCLLLLPAWVLASEARQWVEKMSRAVHELSYEGHFVYLREGRMDAMRIIHAADEQGERERMTSLTGVPREVLRDNEKVTCILPDKKAVMVDRSRPRQRFPASLPSDLDQVAEHYDFVMLEDDRVSGIPTRVIAIRPRDEFRYGYRLWLDKKTSMLLKSDLTTGDGEALEQVMFTQLTYLNSVPPEAFASQLEGKGYEVMDHMNDDDAQVSTTDGPRHWYPAWTPAGFVPTHHHRAELGPEGRVREHIVYSDGLATVSVYIEEGGAMDQQADGMSSMGAVNALGRSVDGHMITVVGEVPMATVERIGYALEHRPQQGG